MSANNDQDGLDAAADRQIVNAVPVGPMAHSGGMFTDMPAMGMPQAVALPARPPVWLAAVKLKWTIIWVFILVAGLITTAMWLFLIPRYTATAEIRVRPIIPRLVYRTDDNGKIPLYKSFVNTQAAVVASPTVLQRVLDQPDVQATAWFKGVRRGPMGFMMTDDRPAIERLRDSLKARPRGQTEVIDVWMDTDWPQDARTVVNAVLDQYIRFLREASDQTRDVLYRKLLEQYRMLQNDIDGREKVLARLKKQFSTDLPEDMIGRERLRLDDLTARLDKTQRELSLSQWQEEQWEKMVDEGEHLTHIAATKPEELPINKIRYPNDVEWRQLNLELKEAEYDLSQVSDRLGQEHPRRVDLRRRVDFAKEMRANREKQLVAQWRMNPGAPLDSDEAAGNVQDELAMLRKQSRTLQFQEKLLTEDIAQRRKMWEHAVDVSTMLARESEVLARKREMYADVRSRKEQREMERNVPGSVEILTRAFAPSTPSKDYRVLGTVGAIIIGLAAGMGLALVRAGRSQVIREVREVHHSVPGPFLGRLPFLERKHEAAPERNLLVNEGIRMVRTALLARIEAAKGNAVLVSSAGAGEGKSTVAWMLARSFARCNMNVLLIDADLRNRDVSKRVGLDQGEGLIAALTDQAPDIETIVSTDLPHLSFLPAGRHAGTFDPEVIADDRLTACLGRWRKDYDVVLIDSPPLLSVADSRILSRQADGTVFVVREDHSHRHAVADALRSLDSAGAAPLWGTVFIDGRARRLSNDPTFKTARRGR